MGRVVLLNATQGDLNPLFKTSDETTQNILQHRLSSAIQERHSGQDQRRRGLDSEDVEEIQPPAKPAQPVAGGGSDLE